MVKGQKRGRRGEVEVGKGWGYGRSLQVLICLANSQLHLRAQCSSPICREACIFPSPASTELCVLPGLWVHLHLSVSHSALWLVWAIPSSGPSSPSGLAQCPYILENWESSAFSGLGRHSINNDGRKKRRNNKWKKDWKQRQEEKEGGRAGGRGEGRVGYANLSCYLKFLKTRSIFLLNSVSLALTTE